MDEMKLEIKLAWVAVIALVVIALSMAFSAIAMADVPTLADRIVAVQPSLQSKRDEPVDAAELASAIIAVPKVNADWAALLLTIAGHESALSARIAANRCREKECDNGLAFGLYQGHKNKLNETVWGSSDIRVQTLEAARALRSAFYVCNGGPNRLRPDWVARTINAYAGHSCDSSWPGLAPRVATFKRVRAKL